MSYTITGKIHLIHDLNQISDTFKKREFVLEDDSSQYVQYISFQTVQDKTSMLDGLRAGDRVEVSFNLRGREWTSPQGELKYFNSLDAWRINSMNVAAAAPSAGAQGQGMGAPAPTPTAPPSNTPPLPEAEDDLPF